MSKHSLISVGLGLGLMAASMGANAQQIKTFDYSMVFAGAATGGTKYTMFIPTLTRATSAGVTIANSGAANVIMMEFFAPSSGTSNSWTFAMGNAVGLGAGGSTASGAYENVTVNQSNGAIFNAPMYFGNNTPISMAFEQVLTISSQVCNVSFVATVGNNDQLLFTDVSVQASGINSAAGVVSITTGAGGSIQISASDWNNHSASLATFAPNASFQISGIATSYAAVTNTASIGGIYNAMINARNKCVPAYAPRAAGLGRDIANNPIGAVRIF